MNKNMKTNKLAVSNDSMNKLDQILQQLTKVFTLAELENVGPIPMANGCNCKGGCRGGCGGSCKGVFMYN
jgi:hypothetical protein